MTGNLGAIVALFAASALTGVIASLANRRRLLLVAKPLTTALLFLVVGPPQSAFARLIDLGIAFSLVGDVALLLPAKNAFLIGLAIFLGAHIAYMAAFLGVAGSDAFSASTGVAGAVMVVVTGLLLLRLWPRTAGMRAPLVVYAAALAGMVTTAVAAAATPAIAPPPVVALGAALFYVGDASLAVDKFDHKIRYAPVLTLGVYWLGQLGIAIGARLAPL
jgi:alkenylglycerophosphocholine/alkenylglycerophosphoethanolamine hydrolase